jgi:hypothetical protein
MVIYTITVGYDLTPKELVLWGPNRFWAASHDLTLFFEFLNIFFQMHLAVSFA